MKTLLSAGRLLALLTLLTGIVYPVAIWAGARLVFPFEAEGSVLVRGGQPVGSELLAQKGDDARYVQPRVSAGDFATVASGASQLPWTSATLRQRLATARAAGASDELATASGSGLDPHVSPEEARRQLQRVAAVRGWDVARVRELDAWIAHHTEGGQIGPRYVNVLRMNLAIDAAEAPR